VSVTLTGGTLWSKMNKT